MPFATRKRMLVLWSLWISLQHSWHLSSSSAAAAFCCCLAVAGTKVATHGRDCFMAYCLAFRQLGMFNSTKCFQWHSVLEQGDSSGQWDLDKLEQAFLYPSNSTLEFGNAAHKVLIKTVLNDACQEEPKPEPKPKPEPEPEPEFKPSTTPNAASRLNNSPAVYTIFAQAAAVERVVREPVSY